ncbi:MAG: hypothetical protein K1X51_13555 [Rhodospirillaceae bacterium]|nr:hypothetical protein [Rhodospirillaceae bacterium]
MRRLPVSTAVALCALCGPALAENPAEEQLAHFAILRKVMPPTPVFDNFFYFGTGSQNVWARKTSASIILRDIQADDDAALRKRYFDA